MHTTCKFCGKNPCNIILKLSNSALFPLYVVMKKNCTAAMIHDPWLSGKSCSSPLCAAQQPLVTEATVGYLHDY